MPDLKESRESIISGEDQMQTEELGTLEQNGEPPGEKDNSVFPSIPDSFLKKHDLNYKKKEDVTSR